MMTTTYIIKATLGMNEIITWGDGIENTRRCVESMKRAGYTNITVTRED